MKRAVNFVAAPLRAALLLLLVCITSCATYNDKITDVHQEMVNGRFKNASGLLDKNAFLGKKRNKLLYLLEKGKMEHISGNYEESNRLFEEAYILVDDRIKTSAGHAVAANLTNPMAAPYKGEDFEKVTIHYYKAINYFMLGQPDEALVEAKRIDLKLQELNNRYKDNKNKYTQDAFSQILQGILYESTGDINNAFIAYRNAEEIYTAAGGTYYGVTLPKQLQADLLRTAYALGFTEEYNKYLVQFNLPATSPPPAPNVYGEAIVFWENGLGPVKDQVVVTASGAGSFFYGTYMEDGVVQQILIPIPMGSNLGTINAVAIPKYNRSISYYSKASLTVNGREQYFETAQDFYPIAKQCLNDRNLRETVNIVTRFATKKAGSILLQEVARQAVGKDGAELIRLGADAAGAITEKADTRNWQTLPATISYTRVPLNPNGENKFTIKKYGPGNIIDTDTINIPYKRGLQIVNYFDLGRTQVLPVDTSVKTSPAAPPTVKMDAKYTEKYNKWVDTDKGISYMVEYYPQIVEGKNVWGKKIKFKTTLPSNLKVTYAITDKPYTDKIKLVTLDEFEKLQDEGKATDVYYYLTDTVKPNTETQGWYPFVQEGADCYVTIVKVENQ
ncbi:COG3014 family protein [Flavobacterium sp. RHBU_3]|uniref:COG3014 family protein n=1 Tax=Flavobacterium sp. RHBU_3 TaxID=3391184 RepID=UPI0039847C1E